MSENSYDLKDFEISLRVHSYDGDFDIHKKLICRPDSLYVYDINTTDSFLIYGVKSDGTVSFKHKYGKYWYEFLEDK